MILRPNYLRAAVTTYIWIGAFAAFIFVVNRMRGTPMQTDDLLSIVAIGGTFMAAAISVMFVPRELRYDSEGFSCRMMIQGSRTFSWEKLEAYGRGNNVFLLKFEGHQAIQISGFGFRRSEWKNFKDYIKTAFPEKKCWVWLGPKPLIRKK